MPSAGMLLLMVVVIPAGIAVGFGVAAMRREIPLVFECQRCGATFRRRAHLRYPRACPACRSREWHLPE